MDNEEYSMLAYVVDDTSSTPSNFMSSTAPLIRFYCDGSATDRAGAVAAGYGVYVNSDLYRTSICEPLAGTIQTSQRAELMGLVAALSLILEMRPRRARIICDSKYIVNGYNYWMDDWENNNWHKSDGKPVAHKDLWKRVLSPRSTFLVRKMNIEVKWRERNTCEGQRMADRLAKQACYLNSFCICMCYIGRAGSVHSCQPVCRKDGCDRKFVDQKAYQQHNDSCHSTRTPCRRDDCDMLFGSKESALSHEFMVHSGYVFCCEYCTRVLDSEEARSEHEHECQFAPYCDYCDRWFKSLNAKDQHAMDVHGW